MKKDFSALSFSEKERICESVFIANGPYWHVYTDGTMMQNIFCCEEDFKKGMWCLAASLHLSKEIRGLTFELMANHIHLILSGQREDCIKAFDLFSARLKKAFPKSQRAINWSLFKMEILPMGRRLCIFLLMAKTLATFTFRRTANTNPTGIAPYQKHHASRSYKGN